MSAGTVSHVAAHMENCTERSGCHKRAHIINVDKNSKKTKNKNKKKQTKKTNKNKKKQQQKKTNKQKTITFPIKKIQNRIKN